MVVSASKLGNTSPSRGAGMMLLLLLVLLRRRKKKGCSARSPHASSCPVTRLTCTGVYVSPWDYVNITIVDASLSYCVCFHLCTWPSDAHVLDSSKFSNTVYLALQFFCTGVSLVEALSSHQIPALPVKLPCLNPWTEFLTFCSRCQSTSVLDYVLIS